MKVRKFSPEEVGLFTNEIHYWMRNFALSEWRYEITHQQIGDDKLASACMDFRERVISFQLTQCVEGDYGIDTPVEELAFHEVLHVLLADFAREIQRTGSDTSDTVVAFEHGIINRLIKVLTKDRGLNHGMA